nr:MAG TPA: hypothetical protein [Caudoviricetes sp.]
MQQPRNTATTSVATTTPQRSRLYSNNKRVLTRNGEICHYDWNTCPLLEHIF